MPRKGNTPEQVIQSLLAKREVTVEGCWLWTGTCNGSGRPVTWYDGKSWYVSRLIKYLMEPKDFKWLAFYCHTCNNPRCFNPEHLYRGNSSSNMIDAVQAGTHRNTSKTYCPKGHEYNEDNTLVSKGQRFCRECDRLKHQQRRLWGKT